MSAPAVRVRLQRSLFFWANALGARPAPSFPASTDWGTFAMRWQTSRPDRNVGCGSASTIAEVALLLGERFGSKTRPVISGQYRLGDVRHALADLTAIQGRLRFEPLVSLEEGLRSEEHTAEL